MHLLLSWICHLPADIGVFYCKLVFLFAHTLCTSRHHSGFWTSKQTHPVYFYVSPVASKSIKLKKTTAHYSLYFVSTSLCTLPKTQNITNCNPQAPHLKTSTQTNRCIIHTQLVAIVCYGAVIHSNITWGHRSDPMLKTRDLLRWWPPWPSWATPCGVWW